jgi:hypothetical protein
MMLNRVAAVGFPFGSNTIHADASQFFNKLPPAKAIAFAVVCLVGMSRGVHAPETASGAKGL